MATGHNPEALTEAEQAELSALLDVGDKKGMRAFFCQRGVHAFSTKGTCLDCGASMMVPAEVIQVRFKSEVG